MVQLREDRGHSGAPLLYATFPGLRVVAGLSGPMASTDAVAEVKVPQRNSLAGTNPLTQMELVSANAMNHLTQDSRLKLTVGLKDAPLVQAIVPLGVDTPVPPC